MPSKVSPLAHFNAQWHNNQLDLEIPHLSNISNDAGEAFIGPIHELVQKYMDVFTNPGKLIKQDMKHKTELQSLYLIISSKQ